MIFKTLFLWLLVSVISCEQKENSSTNQASIQKSEENLELELLYDPNDIITLGKLSLNPDDIKIKSVKILNSEIKSLESPNEFGENITVHVELTENSEIPDYFKVCYQNLDSNECVRGEKIKLDLLFTEFALPNGTYELQIYPCVETVAVRDVRNGES